jgi:hypothetical protein
MNDALCFDVDHQLKHEFTSGGDLQLDCSSI